MLDKASNVKTRICFSYNNKIIFAVPRMLVSKAIGPDAINVKKMQENLGKQVRIIREPESIGDSERFVQDVVAPIRFKSLEVKDGLFVLNAGSQSKAALIGRNKRRLEELSSILKDSFGMELKIV